MSDELDIAWYRKYRPSTLDDYLGDKVKNIVRNRFSNEAARPQVMLIHGPSGCGKTTLARILSKYYLCLDPIDGEPCGKCEMCREIDNNLIQNEVGVSVEGVQEIDATITNTKEGIQNVLDEAALPPMGVKYKVLIVDECHAISSAAQNSMLKTIEDIPKHLIVMLATTDPDKVLGTIKSRCQDVIEVKKQTVDSMVDRLLYISKAEGLSVSKEALRMIVRHTDRMPRASINLLEDIAKTYNGVVSEQNVAERTDSVASETYIKFFKAAKKGLGAIMQYVSDTKSGNLSSADIMKGLTRFTLDSIYIRHGVGVEDYSPEYRKSIREVFADYTTVDFTRLLNHMEQAFRGIGQNESNNDIILINLAGKIGNICIEHEDQSVGAEVSAENMEGLKEYEKAHRLKPEKVEDREEEIGQSELHRLFENAAKVNIDESVKNSLN